MPVIKKEAPVLDFLERGFLATVGVLSVSREKAQEIVDQMVERGELNFDEGKQLVDKMVKRGQEERDTVRRLVHQEVQKAVGELELVSRKDVQVLNDKLDVLLKKLDQS